mmetsp:Transcript_3487/g.13495  ORF Transcript_3487/g.13495 Transcript_3487/m.13495 type:complete len:333 (+) Transcript_3487:821-1819(+)
MRTKSSKKRWTSGPKARRNTFLRTLRFAKNPAIGPRAPRWHAMASHPAPRLRSVATRRRGTVRKTRACNRAAQSRDPGSPPAGSRGHVAAASSRSTPIGTKSSSGATKWPRTTCPCRRPSKPAARSSGSRPPSRNGSKSRWYSRSLGCARNLSCRDLRQVHFLRLALFRAARCAPSHARYTARPSTRTRATTRSSSLGRCCTVTSIIVVVASAAASVAASASRSGAAALHGASAGALMTYCGSPRSTSAKASAPTATVTSRAPTRATSNSATSSWRTSWAGRPSTRLASRGTNRALRSRRRRRRRSVSGGRGVRDDVRLSVLLRSEPRGPSA